jgi:hypothetical protein
VAGGIATHTDRHPRPGMKAIERTQRVAHAAGARAVSLAFAVSLMMVLVALATPVSQAQNPYTAQSKLEPNPTVAGNVTISTHPYGYSPLSYANGSGTYQTLNAHVDGAFTGGTNMNPYVVAPNGIVAPGVLQSDKVGGALWNNTSLWNSPSTAGGQHATGPTLVTINGVSAIQFTINATHAAGEQSVVDFKSNFAQGLWPSSSPVFDYWTEIWTVSSSVTCSTCTAYLSFANASANGNGQAITFSTSAGTISPIGAAGTAVKITSPAVGSSSVLYVSASQAAMSSTANLGLNATGAGATASLNPTIWVTTPLTATATTITFTLVGMAWGTAPLTLGKTWWGTVKAGANMTRQAAVNTVNLSSLSSSFTYTSLAGGSYTVAVAQSAQDVGYETISQSSNANDSEVLTYVFSFGLPTAPSLSYGTFKVADIPWLAAWQYSAVSFGGASYTSIYQVKANVGNYTTLVSSVVPTTAATWVGTITFTAAQWGILSSAPGIFSTNGIEYYWFVLIGAILAVVGGSSAWVVGNERSLSVRRGGGVGRLPGTGMLQWPPQWHPRMRNGGTRALHHDVRGAGRHTAAMAIGLIFIGAGLIGIWAVYDGADVEGASGAFVAGLIVLLSIAAIAFVIYELASRARHRRG